MSKDCNNHSDNHVASVNFDNIDIISNNKSIYIASDHAGFELKSKIITYFSNRIKILDFGINTNLNSVNYNEIAEIMILKLQRDSINDHISEVVNFGILVCGSGTGMSIFANKFNGIRACNAINNEQVRLARFHNNANIICFGEKFTTINEALEMIEIFKNTIFEGERHVNRLIFDAKKCINLNYNDNISNQYSLLKSELKFFKCGEFEFSLQESVEGCEVTIFQSFSVEKFNDDLLKLQLVSDVLKRNNVKKIIYFAPFLPYMRQDKTYNTNVSLGSKLVAEIINNCHINEVITFDLHAIQIEGFFKCKIQNLSMIPVFINDIKEKFNINDVVIIFSDIGSAFRFKRFFLEEIFKIAIINKNRTNNDMKIEILGDVRDKIGIIIDDMIDSGRTLIEEVKMLKASDVKSINVYATHGIFSDDAMENLEKSDISEIVVSNSLVQRYSSKIRVIKLEIL